METSAKDGDSAREILVEATKILCAEANRYQKIKEQTQKDFYRNIKDKYRHNKKNNKNRV